MRESAENIGVLYTARNSWISNGSAFGKLVFTLLMTLNLIVIHQPIWMLGMLFALVILWRMANQSWKHLVISFIPVLSLFISTMVYHQMIIENGKSTVIFHIARFSINQSGLLDGSEMCMQIGGIVLLCAWLVRTTSPISLADGLELLLRPLKKMGIPVHDLVLMFTIALRFLPILNNEFHKIRMAQIARGGGFHRGTLFERFRSLIPLLFPIFIQTMMRADELATAMISRCYSGEEGRTPVRMDAHRRRGWQDCLLVGLPIVLMIVFLLSNI